jgi:prohibitin 2
MQVRFGLILSGFLEEKNFSLKGVSGRRGAISAGLAGLGLATGGYVVVNHCLFNVEGGHRAIMYSRLSGEGTCA